MPRPFRQRFGMLSRDLWRGGAFGGYSKRPVPAAGNVRHVLLDRPVEWKLSWQGPLFWYALRRMRR